MELTGVFGTFTYNDNLAISCASAISATVVAVEIDAALIDNSVKPLSKSEQKVFNRLNDIWGGDEDGQYEALYNHHKNLKSNVI